MLQDSVLVSKSIALTLKDGKISAGWWNPQVGQLLCSLCGKSQDGKPQELKFGDYSSPCAGCVNRNAYCG